LQKRAKYEAMAARALTDLRGWMLSQGLGDPDPLGSLTTPPRAQEAEGAPA
jgi:hypothetical protein